MYNSEDILKYIDKIRDIHHAFKSGEINKYNASREIHKVVKISRLLVSLEANNELDSDQKFNLQSELYEILDDVDTETHTMHGAMNDFSEIAEYQLQKNLDELKIFESDNIIARKLMNTVNSIRYQLLSKHHNQIKILVLDKNIANICNHYDIMKKQFDKNQEVYFYKYNGKVDRIDLDDLKNIYYRIKTRANPRFSRDVQKCVYLLMERILRFLVDNTFDDIPNPVELPFGANGGKVLVNPIIYVADLLKTFYDNDNKFHHSIIIKDLYKSLDKVVGNRKRRDTVKEEIRKLIQNLIVLVGFEKNVYQIMPDVEFDRSIYYKIKDEPEFSDKKNPNAFNRRNPQVQQNLNVINRQNPQVQQDLNPEENGDQKSNAKTKNNIILAISAFIIILISLFLSTRLGKTKLVDNGSIKYDKIHGGSECGDIYDCWNRRIRSNHLTLSDLRSLEFDLFELTLNCFNRSKLYDSVPLLIVMVLEKRNPQDLLRIIDLTKIGKTFTTEDRNWIKAKLMKILNRK